MSPRAKLHHLFLRAKFVAWQRRRLERPVIERVTGLTLLVLPDVLNPVMFVSGAFMAKALPASAIPAGISVLDLGTGSGVVGLRAAALGAQVVAVDINPAAVRCARINALLNHLEDRVEVRHGDLFAPLAGRRFDRVLFNPPYFPGEPAGQFGVALRAGDVVARFAAELTNYLLPGGYGLLLWSSAGDEAIFQEAFTAERFRLLALAAHETPTETYTLYRLEPRR